VVYVTVFMAVIYKLCFLTNWLIMLSKLFIYIFIYFTTLVYLYNMCDS